MILRNYDDQTHLDFIAAEGRGRYGGSLSEELDRVLNIFYTIIHCGGETMPKLIFETFGSARLKYRIVQFGYLALL
jgi:hypothetical protein